MWEPTAVAQFLLVQSRALQNRTQQNKTKQNGTLAIRNNHSGFGGDLPRQQQSCAWVISRCWLDLANTAWAFAKASQRDAQLCVAFSRVAELRLGDLKVLKPQELLGAQVDPQVLAMLM